MRICWCSLQIMYYKSSLCSFTKRRGFTALHYVVLKLRQLGVLRVPKEQHPSKREAEGHREVGEEHTCVYLQTHTEPPVCGTGVRGQAPAPPGPSIHSQRSLPASPRDSRYSPSPRRCRWGRRSAAGPGSARCSWPRSHRSRWGCRGRRRARSDARR